VVDLTMEQEDEGPSREEEEGGWRQLGEFEEQRDLGVHDSDSNGTQTVTSQLFPI
jgi:hypothetical protein